MKTLLLAIDPVEMANQLAEKGFKWWFLALLISVLFAGYFSFKYLLEKYSSTVKMLIDELTTTRENNHKKLESLLVEQFTVSRQVAEALVANGRVIESNTRESEKVREVIERMEGKHR